MKRASLLTFFFAAAVLGACGARSALPIDPGRGGASVAASSSTQTGAIAVTATSSSAGGAPCTLAWIPSGQSPVPLTDKAGDSALIAASTEGTAVLVGSTNDNDPSPDPTWRLRRVSDDLATIGASSVVMTRPSSNVNFAGLSLSDAQGDRAALTWDEVDGCRFVRVGPDGAPTTKPLQIFKEPCFWLMPGPAGFGVFTSEAGVISWNRLDTMGVAVYSFSAVLMPSSQLLAHVELDDGTNYIFWRDGVDVLGERLDQDGLTLSGPSVAVPSFAQGAFAVTKAGGSMLMAFAPADGVGNVFAETVEVDGTLGPPILLTSPQGVESLSGLALTAAGPGALVVAISQNPDAGSLAVFPTALDGTPTQAPFRVATPAFAKNVSVVPTVSGAMALYEAEANGALTQVFADRLLLCNP